MPVTQDPDWLPAPGDVLVGKEATPPARLRAYVGRYAQNWVLIPVTESGAIDGEPSVWMPAAARQTFRPYVPPVPCPITEPTTLIQFASGYIDHKDLATGGQGEVTLTLHPAEPGATEGRYTWEQPT